MKLFFKGRCYNGGKQHKFESRFEEAPNPGPLNVEGASPEAFRRLLYYNQYLFDICVWCGQKVEKND